MNLSSNLDVEHHLILVDPTLGHSVTELPTKPGLLLAGMSYNFKGPLQAACGAVATGYGIIKGQTSGVLEYHDSNLRAVSSLATAIRLIRSAPSLRHPACQAPSLPGTVFSCQHTAGSAAALPGSTIMLEPPALSGTRAHHEVSDISLPKAEHLPSSHHRGARGTSTSRL